VQGATAPSLSFSNPPAASRDLGLVPDGDDFLDAGDGNDTYFGGGGDDRIVDAGGNNYLHGGAGDDELTAGKGDDLLRGGPGNDALRAGAGNDILVGGDGIDIADGGAGQDLLLGGRATDTLADSDQDSDLLVSDQTPYDVDLGAYANGAGGNPRFPTQIELRSANDLALIALLQQWTAAAAPAKNRLAIRAGVSLQPATMIGIPALGAFSALGNVVLSARLLSGVGGNVTADGQPDQLLGNQAATDYAIAQLTAPARPRFGGSAQTDRLTGFTGDDLLDSTV
jgi:Ca2+-binding RTX toxin-like protein